jgi:hypothetical protein
MGNIGEARNESRTIFTRREFHLSYNSLGSLRHDAGVLHHLRHLDPRNAPMFHPARPLVPVVSAGLIVVACALAALVHPDRRDYFGSWRPYIALISCVLVMAPNLEWLAETDFHSVKQPISDYGGKDGRTLLVLSLRYGGPSLA